MLPKIVKAQYFDANSAFLIKHIYNSSLVVYIFDAKLACLIKQKYKSALLLNILMLNRHAISSNNTNRHSCKNFRCQYRHANFLVGDQIFNVGKKQLLWHKSCHVKNTIVRFWKFILLKYIRCFKYDLQNLILTLPDFK